MKLEVKDNIIYETTDESIHWLLPMVKKYCNMYNVDVYLIMAIFHFENTKHPELISECKNPGNIKREETEFMLPIIYDDIETGIEYYVRMMHRIIERNEIITATDIQKLVRPLEPEWADCVSEIYQIMMDMLRG